MAAKKTAAKKTAAPETPATPATVEVVVTEKMLASMPDMAANGIVVGDTVSMDAAEAAPFLEEAGEKKVEKPVASPKGSMAVLKNGNEYVRTYGADQKDELAEFLSKDAAYSAVPDAQVEAVEVTYTVKQKDGTVTHTSQRFSDKAEAVRFRNEHRSVALVVPAKK